MKYTKAFINLVGTELLLVLCFCFMIPIVTILAVPKAVTAKAVRTTSTVPNTDYNKRITKMLDSMTLEEKVGQMFLVRCNSSTAKEEIQDYHFGGLILFSGNFKDRTKSNLKQEMQSFQKVSKLPLLIGVDEEGGTVNRISKFHTFRTAPFQSPQQLYQQGGYTLIKQDTREKAILLKSLGININLAPVCDVSTNPKDFIFKRSFGKDALQTANYIRQVVTTMNSQQIGCTLKHFPGYGNNADTHTGIAIDNRSRDNFYKNDFLPFTAGIKAGAGSIMVSHNIVTCFDKNYPASLSSELHNILRNDLKFQGVILTDDLSMEAIKKYTSEEEASVLAVQAGNDMIIASDYKLQIAAVISAVKDKRISVERIQESVYRILKWKLSLGLINQ